METAYATDERLARSMMAYPELAVLVVGQLNGWIARRQSFTAYDVTQALRLAHPSVRIWHDEVRTVVHRRMHSVVAAHYYRQATMQLSTDSACCYLPMAR